MVGNQKVSGRQCTLLIMLFSVGTSILIIPSSLAGVAKQDAWIAPILGTGIGLLIIGLYAKVCTTFSTMNLMEVNEFVLGKWMGKASLWFFLLLYIPIQHIWENGMIKHGYPMC